MPEQPRQQVVRVAGARRARLTPAPDTDPSPESASQRPTPASPAESSSPNGSGPNGSGPNDDRMLREIPPHY